VCGSKTIRIVRSVLNLLYVKYDLYLRLVEIIIIVKLLPT
jgi:hypothetical protein